MGKCKSAVEILLSFSPMDIPYGYFFYHHGSVFTIFPHGGGSSLCAHFTNDYIHVPRIAWLDHHNGTSVNFLLSRHSQRAIDR